MSGYRDKVDTERCYFCPKRNDIEAHHIVPQRFNGSDQRENLVAVCDRCHKKLERLYDSRFFEALGIDDSSGERRSHFPCYGQSCDNARATVKMRNVEYGGTYWWCLNCATPRLLSDRMKVVEDLTGEAAYRREWCKVGESYHLKSVRTNS